MERVTRDAPYAPGGLYVGAIFAASSIFSGVSSTVVLQVTVPVAVTVSAPAATVALFGKSAMIYRSVSPKA